MRHDLFFNYLNVQVVYEDTTWGLLCIESANTTAREQTAEELSNSLASCKYKLSQEDFFFLH